MFSKRKRFYQRKSFYGIVAAALLAFGLWMNFDPSVTENGGEEKQPIVSAGEAVPSRRQERENEISDKSSDAVLNQNGLWEEEGSEPIPIQQGNEEKEDPKVLGPGYLIKEDSGFIKIYSVDESGNRQQIRTTDISFSLLSESDQKLFQEGVLKETQEELLELLQDFES